MIQADLADQLAIMQLGARYFKAIDGLDFDGWAACFAPGGRFEGAYEGYDAHADLARFEVDSRKLEQKWVGLRHQANVPVITLDGDNATAETNFCMSTVEAGDGDQPVVRIVMAGRYVDVMERTADGWRFRNRRSLPDKPADK